MNPDAPEPSKDSPRPPAWLTRGAVEHFGVLRTRVELQGYASSSHTEALAAAAMRMDEIESLTLLIEEQGYTYETITDEGAKMIKGNPAVAMRSEAARHLQSLLAEFGLTPASMTKVNGKPKGNAKPKNKFAGVRA